MEIEQKQLNKSMRMQKKISHKEKAETDLKKKLKHILIAKRKLIHQKKKITLKITKLTPHPKLH